MRQTMNEKKMTKFIFIRHGESKKNILDITGGKGEQLTATGRQQAYEASKVLCVNILKDKIDIITSDTPQTIETARIISNVLKAGIIYEPRIAPVGLGIADGLSMEQMQSRMPEVAVMFQKWRKRQLEAIDLNIPGMEPPDSIWNRMISFLNNNDNQKTHVVICTRSIMVFVANYIMGNTPQKGGNYKHVDVANCDMIAFYYDKSSGERIIINELTRNGYVKSAK